MRGRGDEFRVTLSEYESHKFVGLRVWSPDPSTGAMFPVKGKGGSIRISELVELRDVLDALITELGLERKMARAVVKPTYSGPRQLEDSRPHQQPPARPSYSSRPDFDEVGD
ncbi:hypothetical protein EP7_005632 (plasmid) [Isosphaeraceae bacterium EP7]